jgi:hypothetical protein
MAGKCRRQMKMSSEVSVSNDKNGWGEQGGEISEYRRKQLSGQVGELYQLEVAEKLISSYLWGLRCPTELVGNVSSFLEGRKG